MYLKKKEHGYERKQGAKDTLRSLIHEAAGFVFPARCPVCDDILEAGREVCAVCRERVKLAVEPVCKRCGKPLSDERREYCEDCLRRQHRFRQGKAVFVYQGDITKSMYRFKYGGRREYAGFYAKEAARLYGAWMKRNRVEVIVPIPMYRRKKRVRGYNQAEVFARALGRETGILVDDLVERVRDTVPQKELNGRERQRNLKNAFQVVPNIVKYNQILLVDDIYTTGSTVDAVAEVLLAAGAKNIYYICISIGMGV